jgi:hypothetical protein
MKKYSKVKYVFVFSEDILKGNVFYKEFENFMNGLGGENMIE